MRPDPDAQPPMKSLLLFLFATLFPLSASAQSEGEIGQTLRELADDAGVELVGELAAYGTQEALDEHLHRLEEARRRDHRTLGRDLDLFSIHDETGPGLIVWHPKGARVRGLIEDFWKREHYADGSAEWREEERLSSAPELAAAPAQ